jgi:hypothetical protein
MKFLSVALLGMLLSCEPPSPPYSVKEPKPRDLAGTWAIKYDGQGLLDTNGASVLGRGTETLTLLADGTYTQSFTDGGPDDYNGAANQWSVVKDPEDRWKVRLEGRVRYESGLLALKRPGGREHQTTELYIYEDQHDWVFSFASPYENFFRRSAR